MEKLPRLKQAMFEASIREVDKFPLQYIYRSFLVYLKDFRIAKYPISILFFTYVYLLFPSLRSSLLNKDLWNGLPFNIERGSVVDITDGNTKLVFRFSLANGGGYVIKINKNTIGINSLDLVESASIDQEDFSEVSRWYSDLDIVHSTSFLVVATPFNNQPAVVSIQEYLSSTLVDIFDYMDDPVNLYALIELYPELGRKVCAFAKRTLEIYEEKRKSMDLLGKRNIVLVFSPVDEPDIKILDTDGLIYYQDNGEFEGVDSAKVHKRVEFLRVITVDFEQTYIEKFREG